MGRASGGTLRRGAERGWLWRVALRAGLLAVLAGFLAYMLLVFPGAAAASSVARDSAEGARLAATLIAVAYSGIAAAVLLGVWLALDVARAIALSLRPSLLWVASVAVVAASACAALSVAVIVNSLVAGIGVDADQTKYWGSTGAIIGDAFVVACLPFAAATGVALAVWTFRASAKPDRHAKAPSSSVVA
ncbi:hypothetical protein [Pseudoclavibacter helvolus]|uniref:hypothetical protein n=1 Tax=Pseudoclavibacter helvolus TaxID=255205 RepID=UPI003C76B98C